jgi:hypothetical protein
MPCSSETAHNILEEHISSICRVEKSKPRKKPAEAGSNISLLRAPSELHGVTIHTAVLSDDTTHLGNNNLHKTHRLGLKICLNIKGV